MALQTKQGTSLAFNLRNYALDFAALEQQVNSSDDSRYRIEVMTPAQLNFALNLDSITFQPQMLWATLNNQTGILSYSVNQSGSASLSPTSYVSAIDQAIGMLNTVFAEYVSVSRAMAVRMAFQGGLQAFFPELKYDVAIDKFLTTSTHQLVPMFTAILNAAPASNTNHAIDHYLTNWNEILWRIYPDFVISGGQSLNGAAIGFDQVFLMQQLIGATEQSAINYDIAGIAHGLSVDETKIVLEGTDYAVTGTARTDYFYITPGDHSFAGGAGSDYYFIGKNVGNDVITDYGNGHGEVNELLFATLNMADIRATRVGEDMLLQVVSTGKVIRLRDQFLGELNERDTDGTLHTSGVNAIVFADGTIWDRPRMAFQVAMNMKQDGDIAIIGSGSADVIWAGSGHQVLSGGDNDNFVGGIAA